MKRYGESFILKQDLMDTIASYMDDKRGFTFQDCAMQS